MHTDNPLCLAVLGILKKAEQSLSLYELMKLLEGDGYVLALESTIESSELCLFRKNFVVMNALYQIQKDVMDSGYSLYISSLKIELSVEQAVDMESVVTLLSCQDSDILAGIALSQYYLDWDNYHSTDEQAVETLLKCFWSRYAEHNQYQQANDKRLDSLQVFGLESNASWKHIEQAYRQLISVYHPDKGGDSTQFIKIREAYLILKLTQNKSQ